MFGYNEIPADLREMMEGDNVNVLVVSKPIGENYPPCQKCNLTERILQRNNIEYTISHSLDVDEHIDFAANVIGGTAAPAVVVVDDNRNVIDAWTDFRTDRIRNIAHMAQLVTAA